MHFNNNAQLPTHCCVVPGMARMDLYFGSFHIVFCFAFLIATYMKLYFGHVLIIIICTFHVNKTIYLKPRI